VKETKEDQLRKLTAEELFLRARLTDICLTFGNPRTNKVFKIEKRMAMEELFATHAQQMPVALIAAYNQLLKMRELLKANGVELHAL
jgi:hypothetical protein